MQIKGPQKQEVTTRDTHSVRDNRLNANLLYCIVNSLLQSHLGLRRNRKDTKAKSCRTGKIDWNSNTSLRDRRIDWWQNPTKQRTPNLIRTKKRASKIYEVTQKPLWWLLKAAEAREGHRLWATQQAMTERAGGLTAHPPSQQLTPTLGLR